MISNGTVLNNTYQVIELLGKGGMGNVYLVKKLNDISKFVAKELIFQEGSRMDMKTARENFLKEAEFMSKFNHPGLPKMYEQFAQNGHEYLIMEYIKGKTLEEIIGSSDKPIPGKKAIKWTIELAVILDYLHNSFQAPIVYRDLKPANIIITPEDRPRLVDFGIARYYNPDKNTDTFNYGSPGYAAPEQYKGRGQSTPQSDVFGLGVILFQMLTKYDPSIKAFTFPDMKSLNPSIDQELENIVKRAIQLDPLKRYISMEDFKDKLIKFSGESLATVINLTPQPVKPVLTSKPSQPVKGQGKKKSHAPPAKKQFTLIEFMIIVAIISILIAILVPNFIRVRATGDLVNCESNLRRIATALEIYAVKNNGHYPLNLSILIKNKYIESIPICPSSKCSYGYNVSLKPDNFTIYCEKKDSHKNARNIRASNGPQGNWPQYSHLKELQF